MNSDSLVYDFGKSKNSSWLSVNDVVMGGRSKGTVTYGDNFLSMTGSISFENNGGFVSARSQYEVMDLTECEEVTIRYRCEGQSLNFSMDHYRQWYYPNYKVKLPETNMEWKEITFKLTDFKEYRIGQPTGRSIDPAQLSRIIRLGIMTNNKKERPFTAEVDFVRFGR